MILQEITKGLRTATVYHTQVTKMAAQTEAAESREAKVMRRLAGALDDYGLSTIGKSVAMAYLRKLPEDDMARVRAWWLRKLNGSDLVPPPKTPARQRGCPELFEGLRAQPVWWRGCEETRSEFPTELAWVADVERNAPAMREESVSYTHLTLPTIYSV